jgi:hypothetical protein
MSQTDATTQPAQTRDSQTVARLRVLVAVLQRDRANLRKIVDDLRVELELHRLLLRDNAATDAAQIGLTSKQTGEDV